MEKNYDRVSKDHMSVAKEVMDKHESSVVEVASSDDIFSVFTNVALPHDPVLNSICRTVNKNSNITWGLVFDSDNNDRWVLNFGENPRSAKSLYQMYAMVYDCATVFVRETRRKEVDSDMDAESLVNLIISTCPDKPDEKELMERLKPVLNESDENRSKTDGRDSAFDW